MKRYAIPLVKAVPPIASQELGMHGQPSHQFHQV